MPFLEPFEVFKEGILIGTGQALDSDFPFIHGKFHPTPAFKSFKELFANEYLLLNSEDPADVERWEAIQNSVYSNTEIRLVNGQRIVEPILHIYEGEISFSGSPD